MRHFYSVHADQQEGSGQRFSAEGPGERELGAKVEQPDGLGASKYNLRVRSKLMHFFPAIKPTRIDH